MLGKKDGRSGAGVTLVAANCELVGELRFSDQLVVNGVVQGSIHAPPGSRATVVISENGRVDGTIHAPNVIVNGKVKGDIHSSVRIELSAGAEVEGNIYYNLAEMVQGSRMDGRLVCRPAGGKAGGRKKSGPGAEQVVGKAVGASGAAGSPETTAAGADQGGMPGAAEKAGRADGGRRVEKNRAGQV